MQLVRYEQARKALAAAHRVDEVKSIRDKAEAMAAYARQAKDSKLIEYATEIKVRAERRCGELLAKAKLNGERRSGHGDQKTASRSAIPKLSDIGLNNDQSSRYQQLAAMPEKHFETAVATAKATVGEVTSAFLLREAKRLKPAPRRVQQDDEPSINDEMDGDDDPANYRTAFFIRTDQAVRFTRDCEHLAKKLPITKEIAAATRAVAAAWSTLARKLEKSL